MSGIGTRCAALALILGLATFSPVGARADDAVDGKLDRLTDFDRAIFDKLDNLFTFLSQRFDVAIVVDDAAFKREKMTYDGAKKVRFPRASVRLRTSLEWVLDQVDLRYEVRDNKVVIIP